MCIYVCIDRDMYICVHVSLGWGPPTLALLELGDEGPVSCVSKHPDFYPAFARKEGAALSLGNTDIEIYELLSILAF